MAKADKVVQLPTASGVLADIPLSKLHPHPLNPNVMSEEYLELLAHNIARNRSYPLLLVRPHPEIPDESEIIDGADGAPQPLPGRDPPGAGTNVCPEGAPHVTYDVAAIQGPRTAARDGKLYVLQTDRSSIADESRPAEPLVLHVNVGDCIIVNLENATEEGAVTFHAEMLAADPRDSAGVEAGRNPERAVGPGETRTYALYAHPTIGETVALIRDWGDVTENPGDGLYGAIVVGPRGASYTEPASGDDLAGKSSWRADVHPTNGAAYRDVTLMFQEEDEAIGNHRMPYTIHVDGEVGLNYRNAPLEDRVDGPQGTAGVYNTAGPGDPPTPLIEAIAGDKVRVHVLSPWSEQEQLFSIEGHAWPVEPGLTGTNIFSSQHFGGLETLTLDIEAGGAEQLPGDYVYGDHREPFREAGLWGLLRVYAPNRDDLPIETVDARAGSGSDGNVWWLAGLTVLLVLVVGTASFRLLRARSERQR